jgi:hypothetical protein
MIAGPFVTVDAVLGPAACRNASDKDTNLAAAIRRLRPVANRAVGKNR